jgi:hypothetical protein
MGRVERMKGMYRQTLILLLSVSVLAEFKVTINS